MASNYEGDNPRSSLSDHRSKGFSPTVFDENSISLKTSDESRVGAISTARRPNHTLRFKVYGVHISSDPHGGPAKALRRPYGGKYLGPNKGVLTIKRRHYY